MVRIEKPLLLIALFALLGIAASQVHDFDLFWQLQSARHMLQTKSFIYRDLFSLAADVPRFEHCWLHDILFFGVYSLFGFAGISLLKGLLITATACALAATARLRRASILSILFILPPAMLLTRGFWAERPQLWTFLLFAVFLLVLERFRQTGGRLVFLLFPLMVLWVNLHAGSVLGFAVLAAYLVGEGAERLLRRSALPAGALLRLVLLAPALGGAALMTPYGMMVLKTLMVSSKLGAPGGTGPFSAVYNMDWRPTTFAGDPYFFFAAAVVALLLLLGWRRLTLPDLFLLGGVTLMGLKLSRHTPFLFFAAAALLPVYLDAAVLPLVRKLGTRFRPMAHAALLVATVLSAFYFGLPAWRTLGFFQTGLRDWHFPVEAAEFVRTHRLPGNLYNTYDWGGYLMWTLYPDYRVFWDSRQDSPEMFRLGWEVMAGLPQWQLILDRYDVNTVVTKGCTVDTGEHYPVIDRLRESPAWSLVFNDDSSLVFVRRNSVDGVWLEQHRLPAERIDDTILSEATLLTRVSPGRYLGWWEMARIYWARKEYPQAFAALERHLAFAPPGQAVPEAEKYYRILYPMMLGKAAVH